MAFDFDAVVVGSGFGGSVMAERLAGAGWRVCVLERGRAYPPGSFARTPHEMARNIWDPSAGLYGLFNVWSFGHMGGIVSSGLGGGSLIYANVEIRKDDNTFVREQAGTPGYEYWPVTRADLDPHYDRAEKMLRVQRYPVDQSPYDKTPKTVAYVEAAQQLGLEVYQPNVAVTFANQGRPAVPGEPIDEPPNLHDRGRETCRLVGECNLGCNFGSKNSLDYTYLTAAKRQGAEIRPLCEVREFEPTDARDGWVVRFVEHDDADERPKATHDSNVLEPKQLTARKLVLSAGAFGSTFLMLHNRAHLPALPRLGTQFSENGDLLTLVDRATRVDASGKRVPRVLDPSIGPVITTTIHVPNGRDAGGEIRTYYIQDAGYPVFFSWLVQVADVRSELRGITRVVEQKIDDWLHHHRRTDIGARLSELFANTELAADSMPLLGMGRDIADGRMYLDSDDRLALDWSIDRSRPYFNRVRETSRRLAQQLGGKLLDNPLWYLSSVITVHPLGGCPMGRTEADGVVDSYGRVFNAPNVLVADGSVMPGPVGPNPSLTIAALAERFAEQLIADGR